MNKFPLILIIFIISMIFVADLADPGMYSDVQRGSESGILSYTMNIGTDLPGEMPPFRDSNSVLIRDEKLFLAENIMKSHEMAIRLTEAVKRLKKEGRDVRELERMVDDYTLLVFESREYLLKADNSSSFSDRQSYLIMSRERMIRADSGLRGIFNEMQSYLPGPIRILGNDNLAIEGNGIVILSGDLDIIMSLSMGKFSVVDLEGDLVIKTDESWAPDIKYDKVITSDGPGKPHMMQSFSAACGNMSISGSMITVAIMANDASIIVNGKGEAELYGVGTYCLDSSTTRTEGIWSPAIFDVI